MKILWGNDVKNLWPLQPRLETICKHDFAYVLVALISQKLDFVYEKPQSIFIIQNTSTDKYIYLVHSQNHTDYYFGNQGEVLGIRSVYRNRKMIFDVLQVEDSKNRKLVKISEGYNNFKNRR